MKGKNFILAALALFAVSLASAQQTTEQFIPIGMSPGVSNILSYQGDVVAVDAGAKSFSMQSDGKTKTIIVAPTTRIWLDRSSVGQTNITGSFDDLQTGRRVEVLRESGDDSRAAWIKIESS